MRRDSRCLSDFALERFVLDELPDTRSDVAEHLVGCAACRARVATKRADDAAFVHSPVAGEIRRALFATDANDVGRAVSPPAQGSESGDESRARRQRASRLPLAAIAVAAAIAIGFAVSHRRAPPALSTRAASASEEDTVLLVQREWMEAVRDKDAATLDRILADDYVFTDSRGGVSYKADSLRQARASGSRMTAFHTYDEKAHIYGDTAVITGRMRVEGVAGGQPYDAEVRFTDILARIEGRWRAVAAHASKH